ncbi:hypothetical protein CUMW_280730 [Citrus unshiu]|uniref:Uncharacterized protein n=2 Tax=Citrus TaxID=2706 RepID=A0A2H5MW34_CITUN|nr:hypothetical protein CUMW_280730 [Citrus unshiu]
MSDDTPGGEIRKEDAHLLDVRLVILENTIRWMLFTCSFCVSGASLTGSKMARRIRSIDEFEFKDIGQNHKQGHLAVGIMISGLVFEQEHFVQPWEGYEDYLERYALWWESDKLIALSTAIEDWLTSKIGEVDKQRSMVTVLSTLVSAFALPATLVTASDLIDSKRAVAVVRSDKAE